MISSSTLFTPFLSIVALIVFQYPLFIFYISFVCYALIQTQYAIYISIWNVINFLYHSLTKLPASIFWLPDQFYDSAGGFLLILKYFYLPSSSNGILAYLFSIQSEPRLKDVVCTSPIRAY